MTDTKFTPGPWEVVSDETASQVTGFPCVYADGYTVIGTEGMYVDLDTDFANAHLITAAPDLHEALEGVIAAMEGLGHGPFDAERAALAKARGDHSSSG